MTCPRPVSCKASCGHRQIIERYYELRDTQEERAEAATYGYGTELAEFYARELRVTFKNYLTGGLR